MEVVKAVTESHLPDGRFLLEVVMAGSVDATNMQQFIKELDLLLAKVKGWSLVKMEEVTYLNSTALGSLFNFVAKVETRGGQVAFLKIHPRMKTVFNMLGQHEIIRDFNTRDDALAWLKHKEQSRSASGAGEFVKPCPACRYHIKFAVSGYYLCPNCRTCLQLDDNLQLRRIPLESTEYLELVFPCRPAYYRNVKQILDGVCEQMGYPADEREAVRHLSDELLSLVGRERPEGENFILTIVACPTFLRLGMKTRALLSSDRGKEQDLVCETIRALSKRVDFVTVGDYELVSLEREIKIPGLAMKP